MNVNKSGLALTKAELRALLLFSSKAPEDKDRFGVQFIVERDSCYALATNSRICVKFRGTTDGKADIGARFVDRKFLVDCKKELEGKQVARLRFKDDKLIDCAIEENGFPTLKITTPRDAVISQALFPMDIDALKVPRGGRKISNCIALSAEYAIPLLRAIEAVSGGGQPMFDCYPPGESQALFIFRAGIQDETTVIGGIKPGVSEEAVKSEQTESDAESSGPLFDGAEAPGKKGKKGKKTDGEEEPADPVDALDADE
jgi:hypothetical protein